MNVVFLRLAVLVKNEDLLSQGPNIIDICKKRTFVKIQNLRVTTSLLNALTERFILSLNDWRLEIFEQ